MGSRITVDDTDVYVDGYNVQESSTPVIGSDTSGSVGSIGTAFPSKPLHRLWSNKPVALEDTRQGTTLGRAFSISMQDDTGMSTLSAVTRLGDLAIRNVQAQPYSGTLEGAFTYYLSLAGITSGFQVLGNIGSRPVAYPGWFGELWTQLKLLCSVEQVEIALVSNNITLRPVGSRVARTDRDASRGRTVDAQQLALTVQAYCYFNEAITDEIVYPVPAVEPQVINVNAGETTVTTIQLSASLSDVEQPTAKLFVPRGGTGDSEYTIIGNDNLPIAPAAWADHGGSLSIAINPDTASVDVTVTGATGLPSSDGSEITSYRIALSDDQNTYSTLYFKGSGVRFDKRLYTFRTGVAPAQTSQEVGVQIDNPMVSTLQQVYRVGTSAARQYAGRTMSLSASVTAVNKRGDTGTANYPTYNFVQDELAAGLTYSDVQALPQFSGTYSDVQAYLYSLVQDDFENQVFGNVGGARIWDEASLRWYRIREASITPGGISVSQADSDLKHDDIQPLFGTYTYAQLQAIYDDYAYDEANLLGAYVG